MSRTIASSLVLASASAAKCPDLHQFRTESVLGGIDYNKFTGDWWEVAYEDVAQVGAKCQKFRNDKTDAGFEQ